MADVKWIKITTDVFDDEKILLIESLPEADSIIVIWFKLLCLAGKQNNSGVFVMGNAMPYTDKMLATIFRRKESTVQMALKTFEQFGMVELVDGVITIPNWGKHQNMDQLENKKAYMRNYMKEYREKQKALAGKSDCKTNSKSNVSEADKDIEREEEKEIDLYSGGDDTRVRALSTGTDVDMLKNAVSSFSKRYFCREMTDYELQEIRGMIQSLHHKVGEPEPPFRFGEDEEEILEAAFEAAAKAGSPNIAYIGGVFRNLWQRGIRSADDYFAYEVQRDRKKGIV